MTTIGPDSMRRIQTAMGLLYQRPETTLTARVTQVREEADLAAESMRSPHVGLLCFRQGH